MAQHSFIGFGLCVLLAAVAGCGGAGDEGAGGAGAAPGTQSGESCPSPSSVDFLMRPTNLEPATDLTSPLWDFKSANGRLFFVRNSHLDDRNPLLAIPTSGGEAEQIFDDCGSYQLDGSDLICQLDGRRYFRVPQAGGTAVELASVTRPFALTTAWTSDVVVLEDGDYSMTNPDDPDNEDAVLTTYFTHDLASGEEQELASIWTPLSAFIHEQSLYVVTEDAKGMASLSSVPLSGGKFTTVLTTKLSKLEVLSTRGTKWLVSAVKPPEAGALLYWMSLSDASVEGIEGYASDRISKYTDMARAESGYAFNLAEGVYYVADGSREVQSVPHPCVDSDPTFHSIAAEGNTAFVNAHDFGTATNAIIRVSLPR